MTLIEPDVALTDFGLAIECALFAGWLVWRGSSRSALGRWFVVLFVALGTGALLGGITHGFMPDPGSDAARAVWNATLIAIGSRHGRAGASVRTCCSPSTWRGGS